MEKICPICGKTLKDDATVCTKCGTAVPSAPAAPVEETPVVETPVVEIPVEETPVVETPVVEIPVEETPVVEAPTPKFCIKCGNPLEAGVAFCGKCGAPVAATAPSNETPAPAPKKPMSKKTKTIIGVAAAVAAVILIAIIIIASISTPETALNNYAAIMSGDMSKVESMAPAAYWNYVAESEGVSKRELIAELKEEYAENVDELKERYGLYKVTGEILTETDMSDETLELIAEGLTKYGIKKSDVKEGKTLKVELRIQGLSDSDANTGNLHAVKIGTSWYLIYYYTWSGQTLVYFLVN